MGNISEIFAEEITDDTTIWRYRGFKRFNQLLNESRLHLHLIDDLDDPFEGSIPSAVDKLRRKSGTQSEVGLDKALNREFPKYTFCNCWHIGENESANMWDSYSGDRLTVAIKSTVGDLKESLESVSQDMGNIYLADIRYIDFANDSYSEFKQKLIGEKKSPIQWSVIKRASFRHENELRLLNFNIPTIDEDEYEFISCNIKSDEGDYKEKITLSSGEGIVDLRSPLKSTGVNLQVDVSTLINQIHVDPGSEEEYVEMIRNTMDKLGYNPDKVKRSDLDSDAIF